ncbi:hypothetical protein FHS83_000494 [Rhizomicrobium palustre]|uniref:Uncharacterized protein n=1 Tax=Rhizomicrobium palustre TaxID=189966 RepID=A0A846MUY6_9PROT|nr:hypothetical protein [Rhizomicrobium palustre]NIK87176.1 hypothetical protein [Rhizomicrobium palustre]
MTRKPKALKSLLAEIDTAIKSTRAAGHVETAAMLRLARIDLMLRAAGISASEVPLDLVHEAAKTAKRAPKRPRG